MKISDFKNNCTLVAAKEVSGKDDAAILEAFCKRGYKANEGVHAYTFLPALQDLGLTIKEVSVRGSKDTFVERICSSTGYERSYYNPARFISLGAFCKKNPVGVFFVYTRNHAFVVREGKVIDPNVTRGPKKKLTRRLYGAQRIMNPASSTYAEEVKADVTYKLKKGDDPVVAFTFGASDRRRGTKGYAMEYQARVYIVHKAKTGRQVGVRLSELCAQTTYERSYAAYDLKRGILKIVNEKESIYA